MLHSSSSLCRLPARLPVFVDTVAVDPLCLQLLGIFGAPLLCSNFQSVVQIFHQLSGATHLRSFPLSSFVHRLESIYFCSSWGDRSSSSASRVCRISFKIFARLVFEVQLSIYLFSSEVYLYVESEKKIIIQKHCVSHTAFLFCSRVQSSESRSLQLIRIFTLNLKKVKSKNTASVIHHFCFFSVFFGVFWCSHIL